jgi:DNA polymerase kappa
MTAEPGEEQATLDNEVEDDNLKTLKYHLLGPSLTKAGQDKVDQSKVGERKCTQSPLYLD